MNLIQRIKQPTPKPFKRLAKIAAILSGISIAIAASPVALPAIITTIAGYCAVAGGVAAAIASVVTPNEGEIQEITEEKKRLKKLIKSNENP